MPNNISVTVLTKNSQKYLSRCLHALQPFPEVVVLDNGSTDDTLTIAVSFPNVRVKTSPFIGFGPLKNLAASYTTNPWVLSVDSDEVLTEALVQELLTLELQDTQKVYSVERDNYYAEKLIKGCGWGNDVVPRLYNKLRTGFSDLQVHEYIITEGLEVLKLKHRINHFPYDSASQLVQKMDKYTSLFAEEKRFRKKSSPGLSIGKWAFSLFRNYVLQRGFMFGYEGMLISFTNANATYYKYMKLYEQNKQFNISLVVVANSSPTELTTALQNLSTRYIANVIVVGSASSGTKAPQVPVTYLPKAKGVLYQALAACTGEYVIVAELQHLQNALLLAHKQNAWHNCFVADKHQNSVSFWRNDLTAVPSSSQPLQPAASTIKEVARQLQAQGLELKQIQK
ncbi:glycosyltransferase family 2 protein [Pontibacter harenae]|uniref:glycosyltransferase family 2 protein n=1 Tax=Pontibacter harenae TaxID=2894083 RepID=UPI001E2A6DDE|nr:glycosyltransferase family 2 protein [Pontibacter harenae]MCC9165840.1 glycosyltransferase family 2 protein [Pontibacter harenae]